MTCKLRICHISDIHIRSLQRHSEQRIVFQSLINQARELGTDYFFIGGDIWHTKVSGLSSEYISLLSELLKGLAEIAPVRMMLGNHDFSQANTTRLDAISPIIDLLNDPRIILYKHSGVYKLEPGVNLAVFSLWDEDRWDIVKPVTGEYNIACYHGSVRGAKTEGGWELTDGITTDFFEQYDAVFLGDIHKPQFLGYRDYERVVDEEDLKNYPDAEILEWLDDD